MFAQARLNDFRYLPPVTLHLRCLALLLVAGLCNTLPGYAAESGAVTVNDTEIRLDGDVYLLDAQFLIALSSGAREALENNIPLVFDLQVQTVRKHRWWWDAIATETRQSRQLEYHALSRSYIVTDMNTGIRSSYRRVEEALQATGSIRDLALIKRQKLKDDGIYEVRLRGILDIESLPTPVRLPAYVSSAWDMDSKWYTWPLVP
jgi:hypothetical protein